MTAQKDVCPSRALTIGGRSLKGTRERDREKTAMLQSLGWTVLVIWQCETVHLEALESRLLEFVSKGESRSATHVRSGDAWPNDFRKRAAAL